MLKLRDFRPGIKGLPDLLPYAALAAPGVILNKDGSFLAGWEIRGQDTASAMPSELDFVAEKFNQAVKMTGSGWMFHVDAIRTPHNAYPPRHACHFPDAVTRIIDEERREFFSGDTCYRTDTYLIATYKPDLKAAKLAGSAQLGVAFKEPLKKGLETFQATLDEIQGVLKAILHMVRLGEYDARYDDGPQYRQSDLFTHLQHCLTGEFHPMRVPETPMYLDALLGSQDLTGGIIPRIGSRYLVVLSIDGLPQESYPAMLSRLDELPLHYRFSSRFICLDQYEAGKEIDSQRKGWQQQVFRFIDKFFNNPNARANRDAQLMTEDAEQALTDVQGGYVGAGYLTSCIVLMHEDIEHLQDHARALRSVVQNLGFGCRIETINALEAWLGSLPGNGYANLRRPMVNTLNLPHLLPLSSVWTGNEFCPCPFYPPESPPLAVLTTAGNTPWWFNIHDGDLGHTLIMGPTGSGKSTLLGLIAAQFCKYRNAHVFVFDKGRSMLPLCLGAGGSHYDIGESGGLSFAPLMRISESDAEMTWAEEWVESLLTLQGLAVLPSHRNNIHFAMQLLRESPENERSLENLMLIIRDEHIQTALRHYTKHGAMRTLLDADADALGISPFMVFEIEELMNMGDKNLIPVLTYLFHRVEKALKGQPSLLILDEAWIMLGHPVFRAKITEWLKVFRKANCAVVLATQSLSDAKNSGILAELVESCPSKIFLANRAAWQTDQHSAYKDIALSDRQVEIIASATPKQDYYIVSPSGRRLVNLALGPKTLAFIGASDKESLARIQTLHAQYGADWHLHWLQERDSV